MSWATQTNDLWLINNNSDRLNQSALWSRIYFGSAEADILWRDPLGYSRAT